MKKFAAELADFLRRYYPEASHDGWYRFSADIKSKAVMSTLKSRF